METQNAEPLAVFVTNGTKGLTVTAAREQFGYSMKPYDEADPAEFELVHYDDQQQPVGFKPIRFVNGRYEAYDERVARCLREHKGNTDKGGSDFMEIPAGAISHVKRLISGAEIPEGGLTDEDVALLRTLEKRAKTITPPVLKTAAGEYAQAVERFAATGVKAAGVEDGAAVVRVRIIDLLEILQANGITAPEDEADERGSVA